MKHFVIIPPVVILLLGMTSPTANAGKLEYNFKREDAEGMGPVMQREIAGMQYLLNAYQIRQFIQLPNDTERREWVNRYWLSKDPTPDTPKNEMMVEHYIRAKLARQFFKRKKWPGWDKRGEIFIRYGAPGVRARIPAEVTVRKTHAPGELWHYPEHTMVVIFRDETLTGNYVYAINALGATQDMNPDLAEYLTYDTDRSLQRIIPADFIEFYRDPETDPDAMVDWSPMHDAMLGPQQAKVVRPRMRGVSERWDEPTNPDLARATPHNPFCSSAI